MWLHAAFYDGRPGCNFVVLDMYIDRNKVIKYDKFKPLPVILGCILIAHHYSV